MVLKGISHQHDLHLALLLYPFSWIFLSSFFLEQYPFHVSLPPHHHIHSMKKQPYPLWKEKLHLELTENTATGKFRSSYRKMKHKTSSKRRCTETYLPPLWELLLTIRSTILSASSLIEFENLSASKFAKHLSLWTFEGTAWANLLEKGAIRTALKHGLRETIYSCYIQCNTFPWLKFKETKKSRIHNSRRKR